jgi:beta-phosphoglucomutase-like phosphatase (HAD superfamily)
VVTAARDLRTRSAPDGFRSTATDLEIEAAEATVLQDAMTGVHAGRTGGHGHVVEVDRSGAVTTRRVAGADPLVGDLAALSSPSHLEVTR